MKSSLRILALVALGIFAAMTALAAEQLYTCGMHPQIIKKEPGNCPICGMKLTPIRANGPAKAAAGERTIKFYKSTMMPGEVSPKPTKDSMGMDMVPVYDGDDSDRGNTDPAAVGSAAIERLLVDRLAALPFPSVEDWETYARRAIADFHAPAGTTSFVVSLIESTSASGATTRIVTPFTRAISSSGAVSPGCSASVVRISSPADNERPHTTVLQPSVVA